MGAPFCFQKNSKIILSTPFFMFHSKINLYVLLLMLHANIYLNSCGVYEHVDSACTPKPPPALLHIPVSFVNTSDI